VSIRVIWTVPARPNRTEVSTVIRSRTVRLAATAVLGTAVLAGTSACGSGPMKAGAAAVIDGHRVSDNEIQSRVSEVQNINAEYAAQISKIQAAIAASGSSPSAPSPDVARDQVNLMVNEALWVKAAQLSSATATSQDDATQVQALSSQADQAYQAAGLPATGSVPDRVSVTLAAEGANIPPSGVNDLAHISALQNAVVKAVAAKLNVDPSTINQQGPLLTAVEQLVTQAGKAVEGDTTVSPRYASSATLNPQSLSMVLGSATPSWVRTVSAAPAAPPAAQG
jgi:hypothetical protein